MPDESVDILLAERMHWTLEYVRGMDIDEYLDVLNTINALDVARAHERQSEAFRAAARR